MIGTIPTYIIGLLAALPSLVFAQADGLALSLEQSMALLRRDNKSLKIAGKEVEWARSEQQRLNSFWYPSVGAAGAFVHLSNPVEVKQPLNTLTDPAKDYVHSLFPDDQLITGLLDQIGRHTLTFPLMSQNLTTIDANLTWPLFTGGKRIYAGKIGKAMVGIAEVNRNQTEATQQALLVAAYFALRLGTRVVSVKEQTYASLKLHFDQALKLEQNGMINRAERLFAQVSMDEAKRELDSARKELGVARQALKSILGIESDTEIQTTTALFINETLPAADYFKQQLAAGNYVVNQLQLQQSIAANELRIGRSAYLPVIALFGKQTLYAQGVDKYLMPRTMVGVGFTWNLFDGLNREKRIRQARITGESLLLGKEKALSELAVGVDKWYSQLQNALADVRALSTTIEMSNELVRIRKKSFQEGMATSAEVVDAEVMLSKVRTASLLAYYQYDVALVNLLAICGTPEAFLHYKEAGQTEHFLFSNE